MIAPTSGEAVINGMSIRNQMGRIRQNLGVCPQFDILWPDISVKEHLELYAAIKGYSRKDTRQVVLAAAHDVGETSQSNVTCTISTMASLQLKFSFRFKTQIVYSNVMEEYINLLC